MAVLSTSFTTLVMAEVHSAPVKVRGGVRG